MVFPWFSHGFPMGFSTLDMMCQESQGQGHHVASPHLCRHGEAAPQQPRAAAAARGRAANGPGAAHGGEGRGQQVEGGAVEDLGERMGWAEAPKKTSWEIQTNS